MQKLPLERQTVVDLLEASISRWNGSVSSLAREAGVSPSTVTRFLKDPATVAIPKRATVNKIVNVVSPGAQDTNQRPLSGQPGVYSVLIAGEVRTGIWIEHADDLDYGPPVVVDVGVEGLGPLSAYLAATAESTGGRWPAGTLLIVEDTQIPEPTFSGVYRRVRGDLVETTYRDFRRAGGAGITLTPPRSTGLDWVETPWTSPFRAEKIREDDTDAFMGRVIATVWRGLA